jgi:hypothetical protein
MILPFLYHHIDRAKRGEIINAIADCHVKGLTSIMLHEAPGNSIRLFYAHADHEMHWSCDMADPMPLAIHAHRTDISLVGLFGEAASIVYKRQQGAPWFQACRFASQIADGEASLVALNRWVSLAEDRARLLCFGSDQHLDARELHTVTVPRGQAAAWLVMEGCVDEDPSSICYTNNPTWNPEGLYRPASCELALSVLASVAQRLP